MIEGLFYNQSHFGTLELGIMELNLRRVRLGLRQVLTKTIIFITTTTEGSVGGPSKKFAPCLGCEAE